MLPSSLPRHPPRGRQLGTNSLIVVVSRSMIWLQHKASCYRGHGYSNRLIIPAGVHWRDSTTLGSPGGGNRVRERSTKAIRHKATHPSAINREVIHRTISYVRWALDPNPNVLLHGAWLAGEAKTWQCKTHTAAAREDNTTSRRRPR